MEFNVDVTGRTAGFTDLADATQMNALTGFDPGRDVNVEGCPSTDPTVSGAGRAGGSDDGSVAAARATRSRRDDVAQQAAHLSLHRATSATHITAGRARAWRTTRSLAGIAQHSGIDLDLAIVPKDDVNEFDVDT